MRPKTPTIRLAERGRHYLAALRYLREEFDRDGLRAYRALIAALAEEMPRDQTEMWDDLVELLDFEPHWSIPCLFRGLVTARSNEPELVAAPFFLRELV